MAPSRARYPFGHGPRLAPGEAELTRTPVPLGSWSPLPLARGGRLVTAGGGDMGILSGPCSSHRAMHLPAATQAHLSE
jgi:hypothetical protein